MASRSVSVWVVAVWRCDPAATGEASHQDQPCSEQSQTARKERLTKAVVSVELEHSVHVSCFGVLSAS